MQKQKSYVRAKFTPEVLQRASERLLGNNQAAESSFVVEVDGAIWRHDSESEFFADYRRGSGYARYLRGVAGCELEVAIIEGNSVVAVRAESREVIQSVFEEFEEVADSSRLPQPDSPKPRIFIGHGRSPQWRDLKDHLHDKHQYVVEAYEVGARSGHVVRDVLEDMLQASAFALLVMTGEDTTLEGATRARQNVVHEAGLFQGRLGFSRALILLEEGTEQFSNIEGIDQIRFSKGRIREAFGDVLAALRREFGGAV